MPRLILRTLAAFGFWHYFSSLQTIMLVWLWVNWWSAITPLIFRLFWHSEKESVPLLHPKWYDRVQIVCIVHVRWKSKREPVGALCDKKERKSNKEFNPREYAPVSYVISRAFFSTHRIRDLFHLASLDIQSSSPFDLYLQPTTGLLWLEAIFFQVLTSDPLRLQNENSVKKHV